MKHLGSQLVFLLAIMASAHAFAQGQNNIWKFGNYCNLNFNNGSLSQGPSSMVTTEGCASICDSAGNLLFYSNGATVWDKNDNIMPGGTGLLGNKYGSATQGVAIVRSFGNTQQYYLFVLDAEEQVIANPPLLHGGYLRYSIIDMALNNGLGDVLPGAKNLALDSNMSEKMVVVPGPGCSCWLLTHDRSLPQYRAHKIDINGINSNVTLSNTGIAVPVTYQLFPGPYMRGEMAVSSDLTKVGIINTTAPFTELADFDDNTGKVSNTIALDSNGPSFNYGIHFSPNSSKLYTSQGAPGQVTQYNLALLPNITAVRNSRTTIAIGNYGGFRTGPDRKIYVPKQVGNATYAAFISSPDLQGTACNMSSVGFLLPGNNGNLYGLGNPALSLPASTVTASFDSVACGRAITIQAEAGYNTYLWSNGSTLQSVIVNTSGTFWVRASGGCTIMADTFRVSAGYVDTVILKTDTAVCFAATVSLIAPPGYSSYAWSDGSNSQTDIVGKNSLIWCITQQGCHFLIDTFQVRITNFSAFIGNDTAICPGDTITLHVNNVDGATCRWSTGNTVPSITIGSTGKYTVTVQKDNCIASDTISITDKELNVRLGNDTTVCNGAALMLNAGIEGHYLWQDGSATKDILVTAPGYYAVQVSQGNCFAADTIRVDYKPCICPPLIPNAFTPNHDGKNDFFSADVKCPYKGYLLKVYNRWGQMVFNSFSAGNKWDGSCNGAMGDAGVYFYTLEVTGPDNTPYFYKGDVTLIR